VKTWQTCVTTTLVHKRKVQVDADCSTDGLSSKTSKAHAMASTSLAETEAFSLRELARAKNHE